MSKRDGLLSVVSLESSLVAGIELVSLAASLLDRKLVVRRLLSNGMEVGSGVRLFSVEGSMRSILRLERAILNPFRRMCGIAHQVARFSQRVSDSKTSVLEARDFSGEAETLAKLAAIMGGAQKRRLFFKNGVLVRSIHVQAAGSISCAIDRLLESLSPTIKIELEVFSLTEVHEGLNAGASLLILRNFALGEIAMAVRTVQGRVLLEVSGEYSFDSCVRIAQLGVDFISSHTLAATASDARLVSRLQH